MAFRETFRVRRGGTRREGRAVNAVSPTDQTGDPSGDPNSRVGQRDARRPARLTAAAPAAASVAYRARPQRSAESSSLTATDPTGAHAARCDAPYRPAIRQPRNVRGTPTITTPPFRPAYRGARRTHQPLRQRHSRHANHDARPERQTLGTPTATGERFGERAGVVSVATRRPVGLHSRRQLRSEKPQQLRPYFSLFPHNPQRQAFLRNA